ncbi:MAG TPA: hypothetical protein PLM75_13765, partial [bacterium]|nr:hypothetical protein [bacterium]
IYAYIKSSEIGAVRINVDGINDSKWIEFQKYPQTPAKAIIAKSTENIVVGGAGYFRVKILDTLNKNYFSDGVDTITAKFTNDNLANDTIAYLDSNGYCTFTVSSTQTAEINNDTIYWNDRKETLIYFMFL